MKIIFYLNKYLTGYDFFISYSRKDSSEFALKLANKLIEHGYTCFLDQWGTKPDEKLPKELINTLKKSSVFILLGSPASIASNSVQEEIKIYLKTGRVILPIALTNIYHALWYSDIKGLAITNEKNNYLENKISNNLISRVINSITYTKQSKRIKNSIVLAVIIIVSAISILVFSIYRNDTLQNNNKLLEVTIKAKEDSILDVKKVLQNEKSKLSNSKMELAKSKEELNKTIDSIRSYREDIKDFVGIGNSRATEAEKMYIEFRKSYSSEIIEEQKQKINNCNLNYNFILLDDSNSSLSFNTSKIDPPNKLFLDKVAKCLKDNRNLKLEVIGSFGKVYLNSEQWEALERQLPTKALIGVGTLRYPFPESYSIELSQRIAINYSDYLIKNHHIENKRITPRPGPRIINSVSDLMGKRVILRLMK